MLGIIGHPWIVGARAGGETRWGRLYILVVGGYQGCPSALHFLQPSLTIAFPLSRGSWRNTVTPDSRKGRSLRVGVRIQYRITSVHIWKSNFARASKDMRLLHTSRIPVSLKEDILE